jgi:hypothetical protein
MIEPDFDSPPLTRLCFLKAAVSTGVLVAAVYGLASLFDAKGLGGPER